MSFHIGQLIICVDAGPFGNPAFRHVPHSLVKGRVYTVAKLTDSPIRLPYLVEVDQHICWNLERFRPIDDNRIEVFRKIAASPRKRIEVSA